MHSVEALVGHVRSNDLRIVLVQQLSNAGVAEGVPEFTWAICVGSAVADGDVWPSTISVCHMTALTASARAISPVAARKNVLCLSR